MSKRKEIDHKKLLKMIKEEKEQRTIMGHFGFNTISQLKIAYANALIEFGEAPKIHGAGKTKKKKIVVMTAAVNSKGSLNIPKKAIESMGFTTKQSFTVKRTQKNIIQLKLIQTESASKTDSTPKTE